MAYLTLFIQINRRISFRSWLRHCFASRKVAGSIPDETMGGFQEISSFHAYYGTGVG
jgi:hypothetical protein